MNHLKRLGLTLALMSVLAVAAYADTDLPLCAPGETHGPPCSQSVHDDSATNDSTTQGQTITPPSSEPVTVTAMAEAVLWALSLF